MAELAGGLGALLGPIGAAVALLRETGGCPGQNSRDDPLDTGLIAKLRRVLGRIGSGMTVVAVWVGSVAVAAAENCSWLVGLFVALAVLTGLVTFAPWVPGLRELLPTTKRIKRLEAFWVEGHSLAYEDISPDQLSEWLHREQDWAARTETWIAKLSPVEAVRFRQPKQWYLIDFPTHPLPGDHHRTRNRIVHQLEELLRLRSEQEAKLR